MLFQNSNSVTAAAAENVSKTTDAVSGSIERMLTATAEQAPYIVGGLIVLVLFWILAKIAKWIFLFASRRTSIDRRLRMLIGRLIVVSIVVIGVFTALTIIIPKFGFSDLIAGLGFSSFVIGFATKDILNNFFSGMLVLWQEPFKLGDYVLVDNFQGEVEEIGVRATRLKMYDGEQILIPNGQMYSTALIILPAGALRRVKIEIVTDYASPVGTTKEYVLEALDALEGVVSDPPPKVFLTLLASQGVKMTAYFWVDTENNSVMELFDSASTAINRTLREAGVKLFPAQRMVFSENPDGQVVPKNQDDM